MINENSAKMEEGKSEAAREDHHVRILTAIQSMRSVIGRVENITSRAGYSEPEKCKEQSPPCDGSLFGLLDNAHDELHDIEMMIHSALEKLETRLF